MAGKETSAHSQSHAPFRPRTDQGRWQDLPILQYKDDGTAPFKDVTRQVLFSDPAMAAEWRYFEIGGGGHTTLERHEHVHAVMVHRGRGQCMVGQDVRDVDEGDLVFIPAMTWHQFRATANQPLGFLCLVNADRDRPQLPTPTDLAALRKDPNVAGFIKY